MAVIQGRRIVYLYRLLAEAKTNVATAIAFTTENSTSISRDSDTVSTKSGVIRVPKDAETEIKATAVLASESDEIVGKMKAAVIDGSMVEVWEVNLDAPGVDPNANKFAATYYHAYVTSYELTSNSEDHAEAALEFAVEGTGVDGYATVTDDQQAIANLVFKDTAIDTSGE